MATFNRPAILTRPLPRLSTHFLRLGRIGLPVLALDQGMKYWVDASRPMLKRSSLAGIDWLTISRYHNSGMILETWSTVKAGEFDLYVKILPSGAFAILTYLLWDRLLSGTRIERIGVSLFLAGGFSNLLSIWTGSYVTDTLQILYGGGQFLPFNLADFSILVGSALIGLAFVRSNFATPTATRQIVQSLDSCEHPK